MGAWAKIPSRKGVEPDSMAETEPAGGIIYQLTGALYIN